MSLAEDMRALIARWEQSGLTQRDFAANEGISLAKIVYWRRRLKELVVRERAKTEGSPLVPVRIVSDSAEGNGFELRTARGHVVRVPVGFDEVELRRLMTVLVEC